MWKRLGRLAVGLGAGGALICAGSADVPVAKAAPPGLMVAQAHDTCCDDDLEAPGADLIALAQAYVAAWNAHDIDTVLGFMAPDAIVRRRGARVPDEVWDAQDEHLIRSFLAEEGWWVSLTWARGTGEIRSFLADAFRSHPHLAASNYRTLGHSVSWDYRLHQDPWQGLPGVGPVEGVAEAAVQEGHIMRLTLIDDPASIARQQVAVDALVAAQVANLPTMSGHSPRARQPQPPVGARTRTATAFQTARDDVIGSRAALGLGAAAFALSILTRRRRRPGRGRSRIIPP